MTPDCRDCADFGPICPHDNRPCNRTRFATLTKDVRGKFIRWRKGKRVKVTLEADGSYTVEPLKWRKPLCTLMNRLCFVPRRSFKYDRK